jgi:hypothetical protein
MLAAQASKSNNSLMAADYCNKTRSDYFAGARILNINHRAQACPGFDTMHHSVRYVAIPLLACARQLFTPGQCCGPLTIQCMGR